MPHLPILGVGRALHDDSGLAGGVGVEGEQSPQLLAREGRPLLSARLLHGVRQLTLKWTGRKLLPPSKGISQSPSTAAHSHAPS